MTDRATANLPSRDFAATAAFYGALGFSERYRGTGWMILDRGTVTLEFFPHPSLRPDSSWFSACLRLDDVDAFMEACRAAGVPEAATGFPRIHAPERRDGLYMGALVDPDGSLLRVIAND